MQIVGSQQHRAEDLATAAEMMQIGAAVAGAGRTRALRVERCGVFGVARVAQIHDTGPREGLRRPARAGRQHAVKEIDAAQNRADKIRRLADPHQIARAIRRQRRHGRVEHREGGALPFADRKPADRIAVEADFDQPGRCPQAQFGMDPALDDTDLRLRCTTRLIDIGFDGYAAGGLAVGEDQATMFAALDATVPAMPEDRPRYLMGVGKPADLVGAVLRGVDMFDCVLPTRSGRTAQAFTRCGTVNLRNARHADDPTPLDPECRCPACVGYSRAYLHHLCRSGEILGSMLLTAHNLRYYADLMAMMRGAIETGSLADFAAAFESSQ